MKNIKEFLKDRTLQFFLTSLSFIIFIFSICSYISSPILCAHYALFIIGIILSILPFIVNLLLLILDYKNILTKVKASKISLISIPFFVIYLLIIIFIMGCVEAYSSVNDYKYYKKIYNKKDKLISKFPEKIPDNAENILFHYHVGLLQSDTTLNVYYKIDDNTIQDYINKYTKYAIRIEKINDGNIYKNKYKTYLKNIKINDSYIIYYLYDEYHEYSYVAINEAENECIFIYSYW